MSHGSVDCSFLGPRMKCMKRFFFAADRFCSGIDMYGLNCAKKNEEKNCSNQIRQHPLSHSCTPTKTNNMKSKTWGFGRCENPFWGENLSFQSFPFQGFNKKSLPPTVFARWPPATWVWSIARAKDLDKPHPGRKISIDSSGSSSSVDSEAESVRG